MLIDRYRRFVSIHDANGVLLWDEYVTMPEGGRAVRSQQRATLETLAQKQITDSEIEELLDTVDEDQLTDAEAANVREIRREYEQATGVPTSIKEDLSELTSEAHPAWNEAKNTDDFSVFAPYLRKIVEKKRDYAIAVDPDTDPYETLVGEFVPQLDFDTVERTILGVKNELLPLLEEIHRSDVSLNTNAVHGDYDEKEQFAAGRDLLDLIGFDWDRGRLDTFDQPGTFGFPSDARVCTWTDRSLYQTLYTTAHEAGHGLYAQGLPEEKYGTPLGQDRGTLVHESQAALWENRVFAHRTFWDTFLPTLKERFPDIDAPAQEAYESVNYVRERNPVWVEADELTGQIHVLLRFEIERDLINGNINVEEVPAVWNEKTEEYFGVRPDTVAKGCLQDIHWVQGNIGYFPTYTLGNALAAQFTAALERELGDIGDLIRDDEIDRILEWTQEHIHRHGRRYTTPTLIRRVTGESLSADDFIDYTTRKYSKLYDL
ncbi:carboxypeptidase Taq [Natrinema salaciae]|uniref:Metal-dependent carboxypeptidase n=2 Tax=Natrinema salaciae TaxID=1186196 RepID=A0A1H9RS16_9EURY|nr:carboxypeptidase Taq [Natrinema salaciae]